MPFLLRYALLLLFVGIPFAALMQSIALKITKAKYGHEIPNLSARAWSLARTWMFGAAAAVFGAIAALPNGKGGIVPRIIAAVAAIATLRISLIEYAKWKRGLIHHGIIYEGSDGSSIENAIRIVGGNQFTGVNAEHQWITDHFPKSRLARRTANPTTELN